MESIVWGEEYEIGIRVIDMEHRQLVNMLNQLAEREDGERTSVLFNVLNGLIEYTRSHFIVEEELMRAYGYPHFEEHQRAHESFCDHVTNMTATLDETDGVIVNLYLYLRDWLIQHILETDRKVAEHLKSQGLC